MRNVTLISILIFQLSNIAAQIKIGTGIYLYHDLDYVPKRYNLIVFSTNTMEDINSTIINCAKEEGVNMISFNSLFPPLREYSDKELEVRYNEKGVDGFCTIHFDYDERFRNASLQATTFRNTTSGNISISTMQSIYFQISFYDRQNAAYPYAKIVGSYHDYAGGYGNRVVAMTKGIILKTLKGMKSNNLIITNR